jgi:hypothetical protein
MTGWKNVGRTNVGRTNVGRTNLAAPEIGLLLDAVIVRKSLI